jgi:hypothetical protein
VSGAPWPRGRAFALPAGLPAFLRDAASPPAGIRAGQHAFNVLADHRPDLAELRKLAACEPGKGLVLDKFDRTVARSLGAQGLVEWMQGGPVRVYLATHVGRDLVAKMDCSAREVRP